MFDESHSPQFEKREGLFKFGGENLKTTLEQVGILREITGSKWGRIYRSDEYFKVFE